jgi:hypothetical protein
VDERPLSPTSDHSPNATAAGGQEAMVGLMARIDLLDELADSSGAGSTSIGVPVLQRRH